ncbi:nucleoprotein [odonatan chu-related virus 136]|uniref:nucleoprotein n=1 Tax=odonatan chu-related virus 136 TaxID=2848005 RepID=UPI002481F329|nr:nucleoprotein [odonatan chu-related virus 136]UOW66030.1 nucleoprotein [odonatan chu-related virus 136]
MTDSETDSDSAVSTVSTGSKRGKQQPRTSKRQGKAVITTRTTRANPVTPSPPIIPVAEPQNTMVDRPEIMEIDNRPGPSGVTQQAGSGTVQQRNHPFLATSVRAPRYETIADLDGKADSGFNTSPSFSRDLFFDLVTPNPMYRGFILTHTTAHFPKQMYQTGAYLAGAVISVGFAKLKAPTLAIVEEIKLRIIGEVTAMNLSPDLLLNAHQADVSFLEVMNFITHSEPTAFRGAMDFTSDEFMTACRDVNNIDIFPLQPKFKVAMPWPVGLSLYPYDMEDATRICLWLTTTLSNAYRHCRTELSFSYLISMCRRGSVTSQFLNRVSDDINNELGKVVAFDEDLIRRVYRIYGLFINENNAENIFKTLLMWIPEEGLRLKLIVQHTQGGGLTPHYTVKEAMLKYPDFPWGRIYSLFGGEMHSYVRAWSLIRSNIYYGFKRDLKEASSQSFKSLAYVAKELLIQVGGQNGLRSYRGWTRTPAVKAQLDDIITQYIAGLGVEDAELDEDMKAKLQVIAKATR